jgi:transcriptional regulator with XRE-family HTH domain
MIFLQNKQSYMQHIGKIIKKYREEKDLTQQQIADLIHMHRSNYSRVEAGDRELSIEAIKTVAQFLGMTIDQLVNEELIPTDVAIEDKTILEQVKLINQLDPEEKNMVFKMIDTFLTKQKFKDFFNKNVAML